jgi:hypothetical protein
MVVRPKYVADNLNKIVKKTIETELRSTETPKPDLIQASHVNFRCIYFHLKMVVRPRHVADNLNKIVNNN